MYLLVIDASSPLKLLLFCCIKYCFRIAVCIYCIISYNFSVEFLLLFTVHGVDFAVTVNKIYFLTIYIYLLDLALALKWTRIELKIYFLLIYMFLDSFKKIQNFFSILVSSERLYFLSIHQTLLNIYLLMFFGAELRMLKFTANRFTSTNATSS